MPSGQWAAYDPAYYKTFYDKWKKEYDAHVRALEKGAVKGFEGAEEEAAEVNALKEMEKAKLEIQEREERKALTTAGAAVPDAPKMNIKVSLLSCWLGYRCSLVPGRGVGWKGAHATPAGDLAHRGVYEQRGVGGEDCYGQTESQGGRQQVWYVYSTLGCLGCTLTRAQASHEA